MSTTTDRRFGTFSYLPPMTRDQLQRQTEYMLAQGWSCAVEHVEPAQAMSSYWSMWKLPLFGELDAAVVMEEVDGCARAYPGEHVRLVGYDSRRQTQGLAIVVHRGEFGPC